MDDSTPDNSWFVYIVEATNGKLYTGIATDVARRLSEHASGHKGARFFRTTQPLRIVWQEAHPDRSAATKREIEIKKMQRQQKLALISGRSPA